MKVILFISLLCSSSLLFADSGISGCQTTIEETKDYTHCTSKVLSYPRPVHIYIPKNVNDNKDINLNIHFHGFNVEDYGHFNKKYADYGSFISNTKMNGVLVVPESLGKCATYDSYFSSSKDTYLFINQLKNLLSPLSIKTLSFSGHSGAYKVMNTIFKFSELESSTKLAVIGAALLDATYGSTINIENMALAKLKNGKPFLFFDAYVTGAKATTETRSKELKSRFGTIDKSRFKFIPMATSEYPHYKRIYDIHFGLIKDNGLPAYFDALSKN